MFWNFPASLSQGLLLCVHADIYQLHILDDGSLLSTFVNWFCPRNSCMETENKVISAVVNL